MTELLWLRGWRRRVGFRLAALAGTIVAAWLAGFAWFVCVADRASPAPPHADGIVALTGGADRVQAALRLLAEDYADRLLVSGIGGGAAFQELATRAGIDGRPLASRVTLGRGAMSTRDNAEETAAWVRGAGLHSLIVVTSFYHMPRALAEIGRAIPDVALYPMPVSPLAMRQDVGLVSLAGLRLMAEEYSKFVAAELGLTGLAPAHGPALTTAARGGGRG